MARFAYPGSTKRTILKPLLSGCGDAAGQHGHLLLAMSMLIAIVSIVAIAVVIVVVIAVVIVPVQSE